MSKLRICVVVPVYHLSLGGLGRQAKLLTEKIAERAEVFVITRKMTDVSAEACSDNIEVVRIWTPWQNISILEEIGIKSLLISLAFSLGCAWTLFRKRKTYDIVHFHGARAALFLNIPILGLLGKIIIAKVSAANHTLEAGSLKGNYWFAGNLLARMTARVDRFVAISSEIYDGLIRDGIPEERIERISNFIDLSEYRDLNMYNGEILKKEYNLQGKSIVTFCGRLVPRKGAEVLLRAWHKIADELDSAVLLIIGDGSYRSELEGISDKLGLKSNVKFLGWQPNVNDLLNITDIFVLPSLQEGMPNALLEAMACGLPVIATKIGGVVDIIEDGKSGILVAPGEVSGLADSLDRLLKDKEARKRLGEGARKRIESTFSIDTIADKYIKLYGELYAE